MADLDMVPSFFSAHTFFWGDWHRDSVLGPERAARISPTPSACGDDTALAGNLFRSRAALGHC